ncbi:MAG: 1-acyl-sn-glycerol-3-phosphate acyltransferase [Betaproteobacteria bacterium]|nr:1-acyl-sn-glycerol-3-phosphate acyltransferase [Betaproteobacteria bacterium]
MRRWLRIAHLALHFARGLFTAAFFPFLGAARRNREIQRWSSVLLEVLAVRLHVHGAPTDARPLMLVGNHVTWLDIFSIDSVLPVRFVAKSEVRRWPLVGWLSERVGTLFIDQSKARDTLRVNMLVTESLRAGEVFAVFPEGRTTDGSRLLDFHASLLAPALEVDAVLQPFAIRYERTDGSLCTEAAFDGDRSLWQTVMGITSQREVHVHVRFLPPLVASGRRRREIANEAREAISRSLYPRAPSSRSGTPAGLPAAAR